MLTVVAATGINGGGLCRSWSRSLSDVESRYRNGIMITPAPAASMSVVIPFKRKNCPCIPNTFTRGEDFTSSVMSAAPQLTFVIHPGVRRTKDQQCKGHDDQEQHPGHRGGVAHVEIFEGVLVQVQVIKKCRTRRVAGAVCEDVHFSEVLKCSNQSQDEIIEDDRRGHR